MDKRIEEILDNENHRQSSTIELIASENFASDAVMKLAGSIFTNKYAEGYPGKRYYNGCDHMDEVELLAIEELKKFNNIEFIKTYRPLQTLACTLQPISHLP